MAPDEDFTNGTPPAGDPPPVLPRVAAGDPGAMQEAMDRYGSLVWALARRFSPDLAEAEDAVQEVFVSLWQSASRYDAELSGEATFVTMIARRRLIDRNRRLARRRDREPLEEVHAEPSVEPDLGIRSDAEVAAQVLDRLRPQQRQVLHMAIYQGLTHQEISTATGLPLGSVKTHARRGLLKVKELLRVGAVAEQGGRP